MLKKGKNTIFTFCCYNSKKVVKVCGLDHILRSKLENTGHVLSKIGYGIGQLYLEHCAFGLQKSRVQHWALRGNELLVCNLNIKGEILYFFVFLDNFPLLSPRGSVKGYLQLQN